MVVLIIFPVILQTDINLIMLEDTARHTHNTLTINYLLTIFISACKSDGSIVFSIVSNYFC